MVKQNPIPAMPQTPPEGASKWQRFFRFPKDMFSAFPPKLYRAWMTEVRTPFYNSFLINDPEVQKKIFAANPRDFPKSSVIYSGLIHLLGNSIFVSNGDVWERQKRIINPAFEGGRLKETYPAMQNASKNLVNRLKNKANGEAFSVEFECSYFAADIIFRTLFSVPIEHHLAKQVFDSFQDYQRAQPVWNMLNLIRAPKWIPRFHSKAARQSGAKIRGAIGELVDMRLKEIKAGTAPNDLATKIMTTADPQDGKCFEREEMIDQVAIFFLAGHETSASALAWALYLLAFAPKEQGKLADELAQLPTNIPLNKLTKLTRTRNVFHETLRLYAPVPMLVRESTEEHIYREKRVRPKDMCILSPWYSGRHERIWDAPHEFRPDRWNNLPQHCKDAYFPFSAGGRICIGAGFALIEGLLGIATIIRNFEVSLGDEAPIPVAHLTVRSKSGVFLRLKART